MSVNKNKLDLNTEYLEYTSKLLQYQKQLLLTLLAHEDKLAYLLGKVGQLENHFKNIKQMIKDTDDAFQEQLAVQAGDRT